MIDAATRRARAKVLKLAAELGCAVEHDDNRRSYDVRVMAPKGYHWKNEDVHEYVEHCNSGPWSYADLWEMMLVRMGEGIELCDAETCPECEWWTSEVEA